MKPKGHAWLIEKGGREYQLNIGTTTLGRSARNDIRIINDETVSSQHCKIMEADGRYTIYDLGTPSGTLVNNEVVRQPIQLNANDVIRLGDRTQFQFIALKKER